MKQTREHRLFMARLRTLRKQHEADPRLHEWLPTEVYFSSFGTKEMRLGCRCGVYVWVKAKEFEKS